jgi:NAD(P)H-dependent flavin oxidoreductase YrpB (nitropropane dioxygenase family)
MKTPVTEMLGIEYPIFGFSHCRDVVAAVTNAGGMGVLGAVAHTPEQLDFDLRWITKQTSGRPFGVDLLIPKKFAGADKGGLERQDLRSLIPEGHRQFVEGLLEKYEIPPLPKRVDSGEGNLGGPGPGTESTRKKRAGLQVDPKSMAPLIDVSFGHDIKLFASALGTPPSWLLDKAHERGMPVAALAGTVEHALHHAEAGTDIIIAQGTEAGGHTGDVATMVLVPQVVDAVAPIPVLAAGGIADGRQMAASLALGAAGVWCGSVWLTTEEADATPETRARMLAAGSGDTTRTRAFTGKPCRVLKSRWTDEWETPEAPDPLPMPLQSMLVWRAQKRIERVAHQPGSSAVDLLSPYVGQVVGMANTIKSTRRVMLEFVEEFIDAVERLTELLASE